MLPLGGRSTTIFVVTTVFLGISFIAVCLRCFVRLWIVRAFGWDDALMVFAMVCDKWKNHKSATDEHSADVEYPVRPVRHHRLPVRNWPEVPPTTCTRDCRNSNVCTCFSRLLSCHIWTDNPTQWWWLGQCSYVWVVAIARLSIAMTLLRLTVTRTHQFILYAVIVVTSIVGLVFWFMLTLQCSPVSYFWQRIRLLVDPSSNIHGSCISLDSLIAMGYVYSATASICDFTLGLLPIWLVWRLQMNKRTKIALAAILGLGCVYVAFPSLIDTLH